MHQLPPIAPAPVELESKKPEVRPEVSVHVVGPTRIGARKQWILPPRPKPGRKPKVRPLEPSNTQQRRSDNIQRRSSRQEPPRKAQRRGGPSPKNTKSYSNDGPKSTPESSCGLCQVDATGCLCNDIGLKDESLEVPTPETTPGEARALDYDKFSVQAAVPLQRRTNGTLSKFKRAGAPIQELKPDYEVRMSPGESCGFCTDKTPCLCSGDLKTEQPSIEPEPAATTSIDYGCDSCQADAMSMLFCLSLSGARPLPDKNQVAITCINAYRTLEKHPMFSDCDLGTLVGMLECTNKMIGVQSINRALQYLTSMQDLKYIPSDRRMSNEVTL